MVVLLQPPPTRRRTRKPARESVAREAKDLLLKRVAAALPDTFLSVLGLDLPPVVAVLPPDLPVLRVQRAGPDLLLRLADGNLVHIEFQTTSDAKDLRRFYRYQFALSDEYDCLVHTIVIYGPGISEAASWLDCGSAQYSTRNIYLGERDGEALVARLRARAAAGEAWSADEQVEAILLPLLGRTRALPTLLEEVAVASAVLPLAERTNVLGSMVGLAYNYLEAGLAEQLLEVLRSMNAFEELVAEWIIKGREKGLAQGHAEGLAEGRAEGRNQGLTEGRNQGLTEGRNQGLTEGRNQGLTEGRIERQQEDVLRVLSKHFGSVPESVTDEVRAVTEPEWLTALFDAALEAQSLDNFVHTLQKGPASG